MEPISFEDYEAAYQRFVACLKDSGVQIHELGFDPIERRFDYSTEAGDPEVEKATGHIPDDACYEREFAEADERWQFAIGEGIGAAEFERACAFLRERGITDIPPDAILGSLVQLMASVLGQDVEQEFSSGRIPARTGIRRLGAAAERVELHLATFEGLEAVAPDAVGFQVFRLPSTAPWASWTVSEASSGPRVRRLHGAVGDRADPTQVVASEAELPVALARNATKALRNAPFPTFHDAEVEVAEVVYGLRHGGEAPQDFWWLNVERPGTLTAYVDQITADLDEHLPDYTSFG